MADFESTIRIGIDNSQALMAIKDLQREISMFQTAMARGTAAQAAEASKFQQQLVSSINATGKFSANIRTIQTTTESFTNALEKNKLSFGQYFRYAAASTKTFGSAFNNELQVIEKTARERVKDLQTQYIKLGRDASGAMKSIAVRPLSLDLEDYGTKTAIAAQKQQIFNQLLSQGSTNLLNFGKNTQWAGRQLMVGFTIPLTIFGTQAAKAFMKLEEQTIKFKKVYGDLFTTGPEREEALKSIRELADGFTQYGIAVADTIGISAEAAAAGFAGIDLQRQTQQAIRLSILGQLEQQKALETTISLQNAFRLSSENLAESIDFLNAVENQTVVSLDDITTAIPKVAPVIQSLGGDVKDLAFFMAAMKEGGINASEGANALKSGLASLINPTAQSSEMLASMGINIRSIVDSNAGDLKGTVLGFAQALDTLDPLNRARAIEQLFGKFQFARISTLFDNVIRDGSQASRVLDLATASAGELAQMAEDELGVSAASAMNQFRKAIEDLQAAMAPVGELFLKIVTPIISFATDVLNSFNKMDEGVKSFIGGLTLTLGIIGPVALMTFGLLANGVANIIKGFLAVRNVFMNAGKSSQVLGEQLDYMTQKQIEDLAVAASLEQAHMNLAQAFTSEALAIDKLAAAYEKIIQKQRQFAGVPIPTSIGKASAPNPVKMQSGGVVTVPGSGKGDKVPAMLEPGEAVIPGAMAQKYAPLIHGMIAGNIPGYQDGVFLGMPKPSKSTIKNRDAAQPIYEAFLKSSYANTPPTNYGHQLAPTSGHSFPIFGLGGVYMGPGGEKVFVKPVMDEKAALAEMRATQIARQAHGLKAPEQRIVVIRDPQDPARERRFLALESKLDSTFVNNEPMALFNEEQYFRQLVASLVRVDKDLSASNVFGDVLADVGPAGVFSRASGVRDYTTDLPSMEQQAIVNLLGIKGGAKRAFAESTLGLMAGITPQQYHQRMIGEIQRVLPLLKQTVASFGLTDPTEVDVYAAMIKRLEQGLGVDWSKFHSIHSAVKPSAPKQTAKPIAKYADGVVSVPGPKGAGDIVPAMLSPREAVIPAKMAERYAPLIEAMISGNIPGYSDGKPGGRRKRVGSGKAGAKGKSQFTLPMAGGKNFGGELEFDAFVSIDPSRLNVAFAYAEKILQESNASLLGINKEIDQWRLDNKELIERSVQAYKDGATAAEAFDEVNEKFVADMLAAEGPTSKFFEAAERLYPEMRDDLIEAQKLVKKHKLDLTTGEGSAKLRELAPDNIAAQLMTTPTGMGRGEGGRSYQILAKARGALVSSLGGAQGFGETGVPNALLAVQGQYENVLASIAMTQEHVNRTLEAEKNLAEIKEQREKSGSAEETQALKKKEDAAERELKAAKRAERAARKKEEAAAKELEASLMEQQTATQNATTADRQEIVIQSAETQAQQIFRIGGPNSRRVTTSKEAALQSASRLFSPKNDATALLRDQLVPVVERTKTGFENFNSSLMNMSFAFSSISMLSSSFGVELGAATEIMYGLSSAVMALSAIMEIARVTQIKRMATEAGMDVLSFIKGAPGRLAARVGGAKEAAGVSRIFEGGIKNSFQNLTSVAGGLGGVLGKVMSAFVRFLPIIGAAFAAFQAFQLFDKMILEPRRNLEALSRAAILSSEALSKIGNILDIPLTPMPFSNSQIAEGATGEGVSTTGARGVRDSDAFKELVSEGGEYATQVEALKNASLEDAQKSLNAMVVQILAQSPEGVDKQKIIDFVQAIAMEAGLGGVDLAAGMEFDPFDPETTSKVIASSQNLANQIKNDFGSTLTELDMMGGNIGFFQALEESPISEFTDDMVKSLGQQSDQFVGFSLQLRTQLQNGIIDAKTYGESLDAMFAPLETMPDIYGLEALEQTLEKAGIDPEQIKGIDDFNAALEVTKALLSGGQISQPDLDAIDAGDDPFASADAKRKKEEALNRVRQESVDSAIELAKSEAKVEEARRKDNVKVSTENLGNQADAIKNAIDLYPGLLSALGSEEEALRAVNDETTQKLLLDAKAQDAIDGGTANYDAVIASLNGLYTAEEELNNLRGKADMGTHIAKLREQNSVLTWLTNNGMSTADALEVIGDATLYAGAAAAKSAGTYDQFVVDMKEINNLRASLSAGGGGGQKSPFQQAIDSLKDERNEANQMVSAYQKLRSVKVGVRQAFEAAKDPIIAAALATTQVNTAKWRQLVNLIKAADEALKQSRLLEVFAEQQSSNQLLRAFSGIAPLLSRFGLTLQEIEGILGDPTLAQALVDDLRDGVINSQAVLDIINQIPATRRVQILFDMSTPEGMMSRFDEIYDRQMRNFDLQATQVNRNFDAQQKVADAAVDAAQANVEEVQGRIDGIQTSVDSKQREIELSITRPIEKFQEQIEAIERDIELSFNRPIADLQEESSDLARDLELMEREATAISDAFDLQAESLAKVNEIAEQSAQRDKERLAVADALSAGNVAEATRAMREAARAERQRARERAAKALEEAKEKAIAKLRSESGLSREQIERRQLEISDQVYSLEEKREEKQKQIQTIQDSIYQIELKRKPLLEEIRGLEDQIYTITNGELKTAEASLKTAQDTAKAISDQRQAALDAIEAQKLEWDILKDRADAAMLASKGYLTDLDSAEKLVRKIEKAWKDVGTATANANNVVPGPSTPPPSTGPNTGGGPSADPDPSPPYYLDSAVTSKLPGRISRMQQASYSMYVAQNIGAKNAAYQAAVRDHNNATRTGKAIIESRVKSTYDSLNSALRSVGFYSGGKVSGPGTATSDSIPAMLSDGEYVIRASSVSKLGLDFLNFVNKNGEIPGFFTGGPIIADRISSKKPAPQSSSKPSSNIRAAMASDKKSTPQTAKQKRDSLYKAGGFQGFEAGFQGMMEDIAKNPVVKAIGNAYSADNLGGKAFRAVTAVLSTPVEIIGAVAKNAIDMYGMGSRGDIAGLLKASVTGLPAAFVKGTANAFSGVRKASNQNPSMFEQAAQSAIDNNILGGKNNPEMAALARIIGGSLNVFGDPLTYLGVGAVTKGVSVAKTAAAAASASAAKSSAVAKAAGIKPKTGFNSLERTEQAIVARNTERTLTQAELYLRSQGKSTLSDYNAVQHAIKISKEMDAYSVGPKIPLSPQSRQVPLGQLSPEEVLEYAHNLVSSSQKNASFGSGVRAAGTNPYQISTGNPRTRIQLANPIKDFLYTRGIIPKPKEVRALEEQISKGLSMNNQNLGMMSQMGPFAKILVGANRSDSLGAFVSGSDSVQYLNMLPKRLSAAMGSSGASGNGNFGRAPLGPLSTFMSKSSVFEKDHPVFLHENVHIFDKFLQAFSPRGNYPESLRKASLAGLKGRWDRRNAYLEARARSVDALVEGSSVRTYASKTFFDPELLPSTLLDPNQLNFLIRDYLSPAGGRHHQYSANWLESYIDGVVSEQKRMGIEVHKAEDLDSLARGKTFLENSNLGYGKTLTENLQNLIKSINNYKFTQWPEAIKPQLIKNIQDQAKKYGLNLDNFEYGSGGMVKPQYFNAGGMVKGYAMGGDIVPSMLTPGEFVMSKYAVQNYGVDKLKAINSGKTSSDSVYNYEVNVNVKSDSNPDQIARAVIGQIKQIDSQRIRGNKF
jgi:TP901 family phage tail tape measure protein